MVRNNPLAGGALNTITTNVVGSGLTVQPQVDGEYLGLGEQQVIDLQALFERHWSAYSESQFCTLDGDQSFVESQDLALRSCLERGDVFAMLPTRAPSRNYPYSLRIQLVEADRVCNPDFQRDTATRIAGIDRDGDGMAITYHVANQFPSAYSSRSAIKWTSIPAVGSATGRRNVLHLYTKLRPGQSRGIPYLSTVIEPLRQLSSYTDNELMASVVSSMFTVFVKSETGSGLGPMAPTAETGGSDSDEDYKLGNGAILDLLPNESVEIANPMRPNALFDPFVLAVLRQIGARLELPFEILIKHYTSSYSAARAAMLDAWKFFSSRRTWIARRYCQPIYEAFVDELVATGRVQAPGYYADPMIRAAYTGSLWVGPPRGQIDPVKENQADGYAEDRGWKTAAQNTSERGGDWEQNRKQRMREVAQSAEWKTQQGAPMTTPASPTPSQQNRRVEYVG